MFKTPRPAAHQMSEGMAQPMGMSRPQQNFATISASPNPYESQEVFKPPRPEGMAQSVGLLRPQQITNAASTSYQSPNSYGNQDVFKTPRRASNQNSGTPYKSPMVEEVKVICMVFLFFDTLHGSGSPELWRARAWKLLIVWKYS